MFAAYQEGGQTCIQVFFFRSGQNWGNRAYFPRADRTLGRRGGAGELHRPVLRRQAGAAPDPAVARRCRTRRCWREALSTKAERRCEIRVPQRGGKTGIVEHALQNAREALGRRLAESSSQRTLLEGLQERFGLPRTPRRVEVFDNSHIQGTNAVGAMIVAGADGFVKNQYRKFNIKSADLTPGDDYAMMREVLTRRFKRLVLDEAEAPVAVSDPAGSDTIAGRIRSRSRWCRATVSDPQGLTPASRIEQPQPPPIDRRGGSALAFGVLRADAAVGPRAVRDRGGSHRGRRGGRSAGAGRRGDDEFPTGRTSC